MKRVAFYVGVLFLIFAFGIAVTKLYFLRHIQFEGIAVYAVMMPPDGTGRGATYKSFDGEKLESNYAEFPTSRSAEAVLQRKLREASEIMERKPLYNAAGELTGQRVIARFPPNEITAKDYVSIIRVEDKSLFEIASTSLRHAVAFEKGAPQN